MANDIVDFVLEEYRQLWELYRVIYEARHKVITLLSTVLIAFLVAGTTIAVQGENISYEILTVLMGTVWVIGTLGLLYLVHLRHQIVYYLRMVNVIRGYFAAKDPDHEKWCRLPTTEDEPAYWNWSGANVFYALPFIVMNSFIAGLAAWFSLSGQAGAWRAAGGAFAASLVILALLYSLPLWVLGRRAALARSRQLQRPESVGGDSGG